MDSLETNDNLPESNECTSNQIIKPINKDTIHRICSGQVSKS